jgi:hypothetical protein
MLLALKTITPNAITRFVVDYSSWLDEQETINTAAVTVSDTYPSTSPPLAGTGVETVTNITVSPSGQQLWLYVNGNGAPVNDTFDVQIKVTTLVGGVPPGQTKEDHVSFVVVAL